MTGKDKADAQVIHVGRPDEPTAITAQVSLPAAVWERLTADLRDFDRRAHNRPELPYLTLAERIWQFLDLELLSWEASLTEYPVYDPDDDSDLNDGWPF